jgi:beta-N-acetylhexosaminidase
MKELGQLLLVGVPGMELDRESAKMFSRVQPGGFIIFGRNIGSPKQLRKLIDDLRGLCEKEPIITIDQEGGRVSRLRLIGEEPPNAKQLRDKGEPGLIRRHGRLTAELLRLFGFNLNLCPVLDISFDEEADNSLRGRCYGRTVGETIRNAAAFHETLVQGGILGCGKHFPGYTFAGLDPHHEFPSIRRTRAELDACELVVFRAFVDTVASMMVGHIHISGLDETVRPASLSPAVIKNLLREEMGFRGLVITDDLDMGAILNTHGFDEAIRLAIEAGNDMVMVCHRVHKAPEVLKALASSKTCDLERAMENVTAFRKRFAPPMPFSLSHFEEINRAIYQLRVDTLGEEAARLRSPEDGKRSPVEIY